MPEIVPEPEIIARFVYFMRGEKVMLDSDLAMLYGVKARILNQAVARNRGRFPPDFMFQLSKDEFDALRSQTVISNFKGSQPASPLRSQFVISNTRRGGRRYLPYAFTEQGVAMLSSVLRSPRAVEVNIAIIRTFVQLRRLMDSNRDLARKIESLEKKYDEQFAVIFEAINNSWPKIQNEKRGRNAGSASIPELLLLTSSSIRLPTGYLQKYTSIQRMFKRYFLEIFSRQTLFHSSRWLCLRE